jgi:hypothetical protein
LPLRLDGCKLEKFEASGHKRTFGWKVLVARTDGALTDELLDEISRRPDGCKGIELTILNSAQSLLEAHN